MVMPQVAVNIRAARKAAGLTQEQLARVLDVGSVRTVLGWERDGRLPRGRNLQALCSALGHEPGWFYTEHPDAETARAA
jgi:transcriptional regulator with XRE-family HTH domain